MSVIWCLTPLSTIFQLYRGECNDHKMTVFYVYICLDISILSLSVIFFYIGPVPTVWYFWVFLKSDCRRISTKRTTTSHLKQLNTTKTTIFGVGNPRGAQKCGGVKPVNGVIINIIPRINCPRGLNFSEKIS